MVVYQKAAAKCKLSKEQLSEEMKANGGFSHASEKDVTQTEDGVIVNAPIVILDDDSFLRYCEQIGIRQRLDGAVILNRIRDVTNPDFRHPQYMPYLKGGSETKLVGQAEAELPVLAYTQEVPRLREEYATLDYYELVHFLPLGLWEDNKEWIVGAGKDTYVRILCQEGVTVEELSALQQEIAKVTEGNYQIESENRIRSYEENDTKMQGMMTIFGGFCVLLAVIGVSNMVTNTLGFVRQRKREIARYLSVGMKPQEIRKMFRIEALVIAAKPVLLTLPVAVLTVGAMLKASFVDPMEFLAEAPLRPIAVFMLAIWAAVGFSYYLGGVS